MGLEMLVAVMAAEKHFLTDVALVGAFQLTCVRATLEEWSFRPLHANTEKLLGGCCSLVFLSTLETNDMKKSLSSSWINLQLTI